MWVHPRTQQANKETLQHYFIFRCKQHNTHFNKPDERRIDSIWKSNTFEVPLLWEFLFTLKLCQMIKKNASALKRSRALFSALLGWPALFLFSTDGGFVLPELKLLRCCACPKKGGEWSLRSLHLFKNWHCSLSSKALNLKCLPLPGSLAILQVFSI